MITLLLPRLPLGHDRQIGRAESTDRPRVEVPGDQFLIYIHAVTAHVRVSVDVRHVRRFRGQDKKGVLHGLPLCGDEISQELSRNM